MVYFVERGRFERLPAQGMKVLDLLTGEFLFEKSAEQFTFAPHGKTYACVVNIPPDERKRKREPTEIQVVDAFTQKVLQSFAYDYDVQLAFVPHGKMLVTVRPNDQIILWDISNVKPDTEPFTRLNDKQLADLWELLNHKVARKALEAGRQLERDPEGTVAFLAKRLEPLPKVSDEQLRQWLAEQKSDDEAVREKSEKELAKLWRGAAKELKKAHADAFNVGTKTRLEALLLWTQRPIHVAETLQRMRAIEVLEHIGTPAAIKVLERMAGGEPRYPETQDAIESLERLKAVKK
jgi:hypothetical protein